MAKKTHRVLLYLMVGILLYSPGWARLTIIDDSTGGDCQLIGSWNNNTSTCTLNVDVTDEVRINSNGITLDGNGHSVSGSDVGVFASGVAHIAIRNFRISNVSYGIKLSAISYSDIRGNIIIDASEEGIYLNAHNSNFTGNTIVNTGIGMSLSSSRHNYIAGNSISDSDFAIYFFFSDFNKVYQNVIRNNGEGLYLNSASDNSIYNNNFVNNVNQSTYTGFASNTYNMAAPIGGNYWSDWTSPDSDGDGFVDSAYVFSGGRDELPWTMIDGWAPPVAVDADGDGYDELDDCDDSNPEVNPSAEEICDSIDNNCDGVLDQVDSDGDGVSDCSVDKCLGTEDEGAGWRRLLPRHYADVDNDGIFETRKGWRTPATDSDYTLEDTLGCNCEQILEHFSVGNRFMAAFGCPRGVMRTWIAQSGWAKRYTTLRTRGGFVKLSMPSEMFGLTPLLSGILE
ncbi:MAG: hypothetical protein GOV00_01225 [Candidatus Altiarchaeota archaeon]|nr:hypothetical protein [Candidatus Altiarchaeota archaeon]